MFDPTSYIKASGMSFSGPHVTGAVALIKQAHLDFTPDMIRAALTNTSTNLRKADGTPLGDGNASESIFAQFFRRFGRENNAVVNICELQRTIDGGEMKTTFKLFH